MADGLPEKWVPDPPDDLKRLFDGLGFDGRPMYYDRQGKPIRMMDWARLFEDRSYQRLKQTRLWNGKLVSTIWLGLDHGFTLDGPPVIFESMVFRGSFTWHWPRRLSNKIHEWIGLSWFDDNVCLVFRLKYRKRVIWERVMPPWVRRAFAKVSHAMYWFGEEYDQDRYCTEEEALAGHDHLVRHWSTPAPIRWLQRMVRVTPREPES